MIRFVLICSSIILNFSFSINAANNIAIIDIQYILDNSVAGQKVRHKIENISNRMQKFFEQREQKLKLLENELIEQKSSLSKKEWEDAAKNFDRNTIELKQELQKYRNILEQIKEKAILEIYDRVLIIINELANDYSYNFNLVLPSNVVIFAEDNINITNIVLDTLNTRLKNISVEFPFKLEN